MYRNKAVHISIIGICMRCLRVSLLFVGDILTPRLYWFLGSADALTPFSATGAFGVTILKVSRTTAYCEEEQAVRWLLITNDEEPETSSGGATYVRTAATGYRLGLLDIDLPVRDDRFVDMNADNAPDHNLSSRQEQEESANTDESPPWCL